VLAVVAERGLSAVSLTEVAAQAGVSAGRVQHYFPAKRELIGAAFDRGNELSGARIRDKVGRDLDAAAPREVLTVVLTELIPYDAATRTHLRVRQFFTARALADAAIATRLRAEYARFHRQLADLVRRDQAVGAIPAVTRPDDTAATLAAFAEGLAYYVLIDVYPAEEARARVLAAVADLYAER